MSCRLLSAGACLLALALPAAEAEHAGAEALGVSQVRVSHVGADGNTSNVALDPAAAFNSATRQYLVVWAGDDATGGKFEIFGRFTDVDGTPIGGQFRIGSAGGAGDTARATGDPRIAYDSVRNEFFVVWHADDGPTDQDFEIYGQRVAANGDLLGARVRVSDMGFNNVDFNGYNPQIAYNPARDEYLVVWHGRHSSLGPHDFEVWGRRVTGVGVPVPPADFRISVMANKGTWPMVVYNARQNEYAVAFIGNNEADASIQHIFVQRLTADGSSIGPNTQVQSRGGSHKPAIAYDPDDDEYLVAWPAIVDNDTEIYGQRLSAGLGPIGSDDFRISDMGPDGAPAYGTGVDVAVGYSPGRHQYLVTWRGDDNTGNLVNDEFEIFGQSLDARGGEVGPHNFQISHMGPDGSTQYGAVERELLTGPIAYDAASDRWLLAWNGDDDTPPLVDNEIETFARLVGSFAPPVPPPPPPVDPTLPSDRDGDGIPDSADACPDTAPLGRDADRNGCTDPVPPIVRRFTVSVGQVKHRIVYLYVAGLAPRAKVSVLCRSGCRHTAHKKHARKAAKRSPVIARAVAGRKGGTKRVKIRSTIRIHARAILEIRVNGKGRLGRFVVYRVLKRQPFLRRSAEGCLATQGTHMACPG